MFLVGAGPGDPSLITLRGLQCLQRADVVLYDYLVNPVITRWAPPQSQRICLGKHGGYARIWTQEQIHEALADFAQQGLRVVRLKGGDPAIFARLAEEISFLQDRRIPFEIVPGITAAMAVSSYAGIPLTHRDHASAVALVTGHEDESRTESQLDFRHLAHFPGTVVVYMGVTTACHWVSRLREHGMRGDMPVALIRRCSLPDQQIIHCLLDEVPQHLTPYRKFPPPVIAVIGHVVTSSAVSHWFTSRPLQGRRVMMTRPTAVNDRLEELLIEEGAVVLRQPAIEIASIGEDEALDARLLEISTYDWVVFSSTHGVESCLNRLRKVGLDARALGSVRIAAVGPATAERLADYFLHADFCPEDYRAEALAAGLLDRVAKNHLENGSGQDVPRFLLVQADRARKALADALRQAGVMVDQAVTYYNRDVVMADPEILAAMQRGEVQWITVTSSAIARSLVAMFGELLRGTRLASLSPITSETLRELGYPPAVESQEATMAGLVRAICAVQ